MSTPYTPSSPTWNDTINVYANGDPASGDEMATPLKKLQDNIYYHRNLDKINSATGSHGLRYYQGALEYYDSVAEEWVEIETGAGGGSTIIVTTDDTDLFEADVALTGSGDPVTGTMSDSGSVVFTGVTMVGSVTITAEKGAKSGTDTISIPYFGVYSAEVTSGAMNTIAINTNEPTLCGQTITATYGAKTKTVNFSPIGTAVLKIADYIGSVSLSSTDGNKTATGTVTITAGTTSYITNLNFIGVYGALWNGTSSSALSRTDDAENFTDPVPAVNNGTGSSPFDNVMPWKGMVKEERTGGTMVKIPKYWFKWTRSGATMKLQIADGPKEGFFVSPAHADRGDGHGERDYVYVGRYHCAASTYKSTTGVKPQATTTRANFRTSIHNLGSDIWQYDFAMFWTINMLYLVEFADWNSQAKIGYGCGNNSATENMGATDAMQYHTGTAAASRTTYAVGVQYRWIEGLWDNVLDWCDGIYFSGADVYCIKNPANFSDSTGGTKVGTRPTTSNCIKAWTNPTVSGFEYALYPSEVVSDSTYSTYVCDHCYYNASGVVLYVGGNYYQNQNYGAFCLYGNYAASYTGAGIGSRLQELPSAA